MVSKKTNTYDGSNIDVYEGTEAIRKRPTMYGGNLQGMALHLAKEVLDNSVDEFLNKYGTTIEIDYNEKENILTIADDGRGLPVDIHPKLNEPTMEVLVTSIHSGK